MALPTQTIGGLASGMDTNNIIQQLMGIEKTSLTRLQNKKEKENLYLQAYYSVNTMLKDFLTAVQKVTSNALWKTKGAASSNEAILTAKATENAVPGTHTFKVGQLATSAQYMGAGFASMDKAILPAGATGQTLPQTANLYSKLSEMNGGDGVQRGVIQIELLDASGNVASKTYIDEDGEEKTDYARFEVNLSACNTIGEVLTKISQTALDIGFAITAADNGDGTFSIDYAPIMKADCDLAATYTFGTYAKNALGDWEATIDSVTFTQGSTFATTINGQTGGTNNFRFDVGKVYSYEYVEKIDEHYTDAAGKALVPTFVDEAGATKFNFWLKNGAVVREEDILASALEAGSLKYIKTYTWDDQDVFADGDILNADVDGEAKVLTYDEATRKWLDDAGKAVNRFKITADDGKVISVFSDQKTNGDIIKWQFRDNATGDETGFTFGGKTVTGYTPHYEDLDGNHVNPHNFTNTTGLTKLNAGDGYVYTPKNGDTITTTDDRVLTYDAGNDLWNDEDGNAVDDFTFAIADGKIPLNAVNDGSGFMYYVTTDLYFKDGMVTTPDEYTFVAAGTDVAGSGLFNFVETEYKTRTKQLNTPIVDVDYDEFGNCTWKNIGEDTENYVAAEALNFSVGDVQSLRFADVTGKTAADLKLNALTATYSANEGVKGAWTPGAAFVVDRGMDGYITLENAAGQAARNVEVSTLNGGAGIYHGSIQVVNQNGGGAIVDVSACVNLNDVINKINSTPNVGVWASLNEKGDGLQLRDTTGGSGELRVYNVGLGTTAKDLGLTSMTRSGNTYTGSNINKLTETTSLSMLRNGLGVNGGQVGDMVINVGGKDYQVNAASCNTLGDLMWAVKNAVNGDGGKLSAVANIELTDNKLVMTSVYGLKVKSDTSSDSTNTTAEDLGLITSNTALARVEGLALTSSLNSVSLYNVTGKRSFDATTLASNFGVGVGETLTVTDKTGATSTFTFTSETTFGEMLNFFNDSGNGANVVMYLDPESGRFVLGDLNNNKTETMSVGGTAATKLGFGAGYDSAAGDVTGMRGQTIYAAGINGIADNFIRDANGTLTANLGAVKLLAGGAEYELDLKNIKIDSSVDDLIRELNKQVVAHGINGVAFQLNDAKNGVAVVNKSSMNIAFANGTGTTAADLGLTNVKIVAGETGNAGDLDTKWFTRSYTMEKLTGEKMANGSISLINSRGGIQQVDLTGLTNIGQVIAAINDSGAGIFAAINETGDGLILTDTLGGEGAITVGEVNGGALAKQLGILGSGKGQIDGSFERTLEIAKDDSLRDVMNKISAAGLSVQCSIINDGAANAPYRLVISSNHSGAANDFILDTNVASLAFRKTANGQDAVLLYGQGEGGSSPTLLTSATNSNNSAILGLTIDMKKVSDEWVTISVSQEKDQVGEAVKEMVSAYNAITTLVKEYDKYTYNEETKKSEKGIFFGDTNVRGLMNSLQQMFFTVSNTKSGGMSMWYDLGVKFNDDGTLKVDEEMLANKIANNYDDVFGLLVKSIDVATTGMNASLSTSSAAAKGFTRDGAMNGNNNVKQFGNGNGFTSATPIGAGGYQYEVLFDTIRHLDKVYVYHVNTAEMPANKYALKDFKVEYLNPSTNKWEEMRALTNNKAEANYLGFGTTTAARGVRIVANSTNAEDGLFRLTELECYEAQGLASTIDKKLAQLTDVIDGWFVGIQSNVESRVTAIDAEIAKKEKQLENVESGLLRKYSNMETVMSGLQAQANYFSSMAGSWG